MLHYSQALTNKSVLGILRRVCGYVDPRLIDHGMRVAWLVSRLLKLKGDAYTPTEQRDVCMLAALHDIGAYKTEEIDRMVVFETGPVWAHAVYGSLFLKYFSPFRELADVVLFHHADWSLLEGLDLPPAHKELAQFLSLADRADIILHYQGGTPEAFLANVGAHAGIRWSPDVLALLRQVESLAPAPGCLEDDPMLHGMLCTPPFSLWETDALFKMFICVIDFRSRHTVTHTATTATISRFLAELLDMSASTVELVVNGALLHDLGKVGIPVEILEYPGKLSPQAMAVMRTHVDITGDILGDCVTERVKRVALRHHEKLDGSGYPHGLKAADLTAPERVVAVADIVSALCGTRSYKDAFPRERVLSILAGMKEDDLIDGGIVSVLTEHFDAIMDEVRASTAPLLDAYHAISAEYDALMRRYA